jgi:hypothetical protein
MVTRTLRRGLRAGRRVSRWVRHRRSDVPRFTDPDVLDLTARYSTHPASAHSHWTVERQRQSLNLPDFRSYNLYVWQRTTPESAYRSAWEYIRAHCRPELVRALAEDGSFGVTTVDVDGTRVSRDLIDSIMELDFLIESVPGFAGPAPFSVLDVGAGYGRLAHRATTALPHLAWTCIDAVPISTALCRYYLKRVGSPAAVVELDRADQDLVPGTIQLAVNIHSFNECASAAIEWWADFLAAQRIPRLLVIPNDTQWLLSSEPDGSKRDYEPILKAAGYELDTVREKYHLDAAVQRDGLYPERYALFTLDA